MSSILTENTHTTVHPGRGREVVVPLSWERVERVLIKSLGELMHVVKIGN